MKRQWTPQEAQAWFKSMPLPRGCNYDPSVCASRFDMFNQYDKELHLACAEVEFAKMEEIGFNSIRIWCNFDAYYLDKDAYFDLLDTYIEMAYKHGMKTMLVLTNEEYPIYEHYIPMKFEYQRSYLDGVPGWPKDENPNHIEPKHYFEHPETKEIFIQMMKDHLEKYSHDERVFVLNLYNEPDITIGDRAIPIVKFLFELARSYDPIQPLTADVWTSFDDNGKCFREPEQVAFDLSDVISYHCYSNPKKFQHVTDIVTKFDRPLFLTEWLQRILHNTPESIYPIIVKNNIASYCWGFVAGRTPNTEPWLNMWKEYEDNPNLDYDFSQWKHCLFRKTLKPYIPEEIELIKKYNGVK